MRIIDGGAVGNLAPLNVPVTGNIFLFLKGLEQIPHIQRDSSGWAARLIRLFPAGALSGQQACQLGHGGLGASADSTARIPDFGRRWC